MACKLCGLEHRGWVSCAKAKHDLVGRAATETVAWVAPSIERVFKVVHAEPAGSSRHGKYKDPEARKAYRRAWYKAKRAQPPNP